MDKTTQAPKEIRVWWHGIAALPADRQDHNYYSLRRVWGDHTMAGGRGFYRIGSEDNITPALFQNWSLFPDANWTAALVRAVDGMVGTVQRVRWAYACEEVLDHQLRPFHKRDFVIPDIILIYEDAQGLGLVAFEVKRPGKTAQPEDGRKLKTYCDLPSTRGIARRHGCLLVSETVAEESNQACGGKWPILTWERLAELQIVACGQTILPETVSDQVTHWIGRSFMRYRIQVPGMNEAPTLMDAGFGTESSYRAIDALPVSDGVRRFLKGSECVEAIWHGQHPAPVMPWLAGEPTAETIRQRKWQTTEDRRLCRWSFDWTPSRERTWR